MFLILRKGPALFIRGEPQISLDNRLYTVVIRQDHAPHALAPRPRSLGLRIVLEVGSVLGCIFFPDSPVFSQYADGRVPHLPTIIIKPDTLLQRQIRKVITLPIKLRVARIGLGLLVDLRMTCRAQKDQVFERIRVEIARRSDFMCGITCAISAICLWPPISTGNRASRQSGFWQWPDATANNRSRVAAGNFLRSAIKIPQFSAHRRYLNKRTFYPQPRCKSNKWFRALPKAHVRQLHGDRR